MDNKKKATTEGGNLKTQVNFNIDPYNLPTLKSLVAYELLMDAALRDDDFWLIESICTKYYLPPGKTFTDALIHHKEYDLPTFESIRRCRQMLQSAKPEIYGPSHRAKKKREKAEAEFYAFALEG